MSKGPTISVVMPVFNEREVVGTVVREVVAALEGESFEVLLVDDGSSDGTWDVIDALAREEPAVRGIGFTRNFGHQAALHAGLRDAAGDAVITMDSDGEHPPSLIPTLLARWRAGSKVVQTIRSDAAQLSFFKRTSSKGFYRFFSWLAGTRLKPGSADFRLLDREVVEVIRSHRFASGFLRGFVPWTGYAPDFT